MSRFFRSLFGLGVTSVWQSEEQAFKAGIGFERQRRGDKRQERHKRMGQQENHVGYEEEHGHRHLDWDAANHQGYISDAYYDGDPPEHRGYWRHGVEDRNSERDRFSGHRYDREHAKYQARRMRGLDPKHGEPRRDENIGEQPEHQIHAGKNWDRARGPKHAGHHDEEDAGSRHSHWQSPNQFDHGYYPNPADGIDGDHGHHGGESANLPSGPSNVNWQRQSQKHSENALPPKAQHAKVSESTDSPVPSESMSA